MYSEEILQYYRNGSIYEHRLLGWLKDVQLQYENTYFGQSSTFVVAYVPKCAWVKELPSRILIKWIVIYISLHLYALIYLFGRFRIRTEYYYCSFWHSLSYQAPCTWGNTASTSLITNLKYLELVPSVWLRLPYILISQFLCIFQGSHFKGLSFYLGQRHLTFIFSFHMSPLQPQRSLAVWVEFYSASFWTSDHPSLRVGAPQVAVCL